MIEPGQNAPDFIATDQHGNTISLQSLRGNKVVLYFYPKDDSPGCTKEACDLRDNYERFLALGYKVLGVSPDSEVSHQKFTKKYNLPFPILTDVEKKIMLAYGVWTEKKNYGKTYMGVVRTTFIIDENGVVADVIKKVITNAPTLQILK